MAGRVINFLHDYCPGFTRLVRLPRQLLCISPFSGDIKPSRVSILAPGANRPSQPFPHPWNFNQPLAILQTYFWQVEQQTIRGEPVDAHHRYLEFAGFGPVLVVRSAHTIRAILTNTGDQPNQFERDQLPSQGIARATGSDTLLYANGKAWWHQKKIAMPPFGRTSLFQPEQFHEFEITFRNTVRQRLGALEALLSQQATDNDGPNDRQDQSIEIALEPEIKAVMLEMLVNNFFGAEVSYDQIRYHYVPALDEVIAHIVRDTVTNKLGLPLWAMSAISSRHAKVRAAQAIFEELTDRVLSMRHQGSGKGLWEHFKSDAPDETLRSNIRVFLAGALEATTSYASWAISHLARNEQAQEKLYQEVCHIDAYSPQALKAATYLTSVMDETLRLTPSLYFLPRRTRENMHVEASDGRTLNIPRDTHILLDVWHANRREDHWGKEVTGYDASEFKPERWENITPQLRKAKELLHFGFGHGPRICPGTHLGQLEVALVVGAFVKLFKFSAVYEVLEPKAGVSTKPADGTLLKITRHPEVDQNITTTESMAPESTPQGSEGQCPFSGANAASANAEKKAPDPSEPKCPYQPPESMNADDSLPDAGRDHQ